MILAESLTVWHVQGVAEIGPFKRVQGNCERPARSQDIVVFFAGRSESLTVRHVRFDRWDITKSDRRMYVNVLPCRQNKPGLVMQSRKPDLYLLCIRDTVFILFLYLRIKIL